MHLTVMGKCLFSKWEELYNDFTLGFTRTTEDIWRRLWYCHMRVWFSGLSFLMDIANTKKYLRVIGKMDH